ncbi:transcription factor bHLH128-like [Gastrolobium bilobum]|uniref:transcription factor bHLH128-like n=1 Tax=Gastrolobium bilobum TaxID=150636 RepID=UPI002AB2CDD1|nr:transcription factor bHLH128-like [Gastrolobium bilobum]
MYPSSSSSSCSSSSSHTQTGLTRYGSAPGSLLTSTVDAIIGVGVGGGGRGSRPQYYSGPGPGGESSESRFKEQRSSYDDAFGGGSCSLLRQKSSPPGFLTHLANHNHNHNHNGGGGAGGFTITRGSGSYNSSQELKSQLSFTAQDSLSLSHTHAHPTTSDNTNTTTTTHSYAAAAFGIEPWDTSNSIVFSAPPNKRSKITNDDPDFLHCLGALESQFSVPQTSLEMATMDKLLHIPEDSVPCKIRAKRGCATHPRSIAERERRTRISGKLKKLQDLVPNMDKQTSYSDMLDLAVQHIKGLQNQVQKLHNELENCTCGCKQSV